MTMDGLTIPKGTFLYLSFISLHNSSLYWHQPQVFDPDRWLVEHKRHLNRAGVTERCDHLLHRLHAMI